MSKYSLDNKRLYETREINFIKIFFRILLVFIGIVVVGLFVIPVNDVVTYNYGEIISKNPEINFKAPFEIIPRKTFVSKGDRVTKGDTLMEIDNASGEFVTIFQQNKSIDIDKLNIEEKVAFFKKQIELDSIQYINNRKKITNELRSLGQQAYLLNEQIKIKRNKLSSDSIMYQKEVISLIELRQANDDYLTSRSQYLQLGNLRSQLKGQFSSLENEYLQSKNTLEIQISDLIASQNRLDQQKENVNSKLETREKSIDIVQAADNKQFLISNLDGVIVNVFTQNQNLSFINKGESLISITPDSKSFYARARVKEQDLKYLKEGQTTHLKLDAYYYYQYGPIKGALSFIPNRKEVDNNFYVLIDLPETQKLNLRSGYSFKGDVILEKMKLGKYILKKVFEQYDTKMSVQEVPEKQTGDISI
ncbi:HlyD family efflux transporter periplasmic adaptor subunit [Algibacter sp. AS12]|uniref:HlyD family secretion protein n=1 Tax=Algibacter sp. AS12 TaxID=3135773 RepID=UPI00398B3C8C